MYFVQKVAEKPMRFLLQPELFVQMQPKWLSSFFGSIRQQKQKRVWALEISVVLNLLELPRISESTFVDYVRLPNTWVLERKRLCARTSTLSDRKPK